MGRNSTPQSRRGGGQLLGDGEGRLVMTVGSGADGILVVVQVGKEFCRVLAGIDESEESATPSCNNRIEGRQKVVAPGQGRWREIGPVLGKAAGLASSSLITA